MQKLHLVGFTIDHEGLILSARRGARSGGYVLVIDEALEEAVDALRARRAEQPEPSGDEEAVAEAAPRVESALSVREIQARLRQGRTVAEVAKAAGVERDWVERFAAPVLAERTQVVTRAWRMTLRRPRLGPSQLPLGEAVRKHLADRRVALTAEEFGAAWSAQQIVDGRWSVTFRFRHRGRDQVLRYELDEPGLQIEAADRPSQQLGYVAPEVDPSTTAAEAGGRPAPPTGTGSSPARPRSRSAKERDKAAAAMAKAAAKRTAEAERAAARRARERRDAKEREERAARAAEVAEARQARVEQEQATKEQARAQAAARAKAQAAAKAAAKKAAAKQAAAKKAAAKKAAAKKAVTRKPAAKTPAKKAVPRSAPSRAAAKEAPAKRAAPSEEAPAKEAPVRSASVRRPPLDRTARAATGAAGIPPTSAPEAPVEATAAEPVPSRPLFRPDLAERAVVADGDRRPTPTRTPTSDPSPNGTGRPGEPRFPSRPRRTRPLRAT